MVADAYEPSDLTFILLNDVDTPLEAYLLNSGYQVDRLTISGLLNKIKIVLKLLRRFTLGRPQVVHVHNRIAYLLSIPLAWVARVPKRIYTRHHSTYQHLYHPDKVWMDRLTNRLCTRVVAISRNVFEVLHEMERVAESKIVQIPHGFYLDKFKDRDEERTNRLKERHKIPEGRKIIGMISRFIDWKGVEYMLEAMPQVLESIPDALLLLVNAKGPDEEKLNARLEELPEGSYVKLDFELDIMSLYHIMDVFVHVPIDPSVEAFGQIYVEALAAGTPMVCTLSGIAHEFIEDEGNALVVPYKESEPIASAIVRILEEDETRTRLIQRGWTSVQRFAHESFIDKLRVLHGR